VCCEQVLFYVVIESQIAILGLKKKETGTKIVALATS